jgi:quinoprotein glucose dehydrogenase
MKKLLLALLAPTIAATAFCAEPAAGDWPNYGRTPGGDRHSPLKQIDRGNVAKLTLAWEFKTGEAGIETGNPTALEATPLVIEGVMYLATPLGRVIALDPVTGKQLWVRDVGVKRDRHFGDWVNRGVSYWRDPLETKPRPCSRRIFFGSVDARMFALDAATGEYCLGFGAGGLIDLVPLLRNKQSYGDEYEQTSPPAVIGDLIVVGSAIADNNSNVGSTGEVRGFDARTGAAALDVESGAARPCGSAVQELGRLRRPQNRRRQHLVHHRRRIPARDLVFLPTTSPAVDYYGVTRSATIATQTRSSRCARRPERSSGISRPCTTISGTTTTPRRPR